MARISVCLATHNGEKFLKEQIDSILDQLEADDELIISDDGSEDATISLIHAYRDKRLKFYACPIKKNPIKNFENGLKHCSGEFIFLSDQDDLWIPGKVATMLESLKTYDLVLSDCTVVSENLLPIWPSLFELNNASTGLWKNLWKNRYVGCCMAFRRKVLHKAMPFPEDIPMHDQWIGLVAELFFKPILINDQLSLYRRHDNNVTKTGIKSNNNLLTKIKFRFNLISNLIRLYV